jgi:thymidylate synthase (FAD)
MPDGLSPLQQGEFQFCMENDEAVYMHLVNAGIRLEDARQVLPNACETQLVWTANLEAIMNFVKARACRVNCKEITDLAIAVRRLVIEDFPEMKEHLGPTCYTMGLCFEGQKYYKECNKPWKNPAVLWTPEFPAKIEFIGSKAG